MLHSVCILVTGCTNGDVRLVNGATGRGRVEICSENSWGTICNDDWDESEAVVVCRQLNFNDGQGEHCQTISCINKIYYHLAGWFQ